MVQVMGQAGESRESTQEAYRRLYRDLVQSQRAYLQLLAEQDAATGEVPIGIPELVGVSPLEKLRREVQMAYERFMAATRALKDHLLNR